MQAVEQVVGSGAAVLVSPQASRTPSMRVERETTVLMVMSFMVVVLLHSSYSTSTEAVAEPALLFGVSLRDSYACIPHVFACSRAKKREPCGSPFPRASRLYFALQS
jgi:hypothetical protein